MGHIDDMEVDSKNADTPFTIIGPEDKEDLPLSLFNIIKLIPQSESAEETGTLVAQINDLLKQLYQSESTENTESLVEQIGDLLEQIPEPQPIPDIETFAARINDLLPPVKRSKTQTKKDVEEFCWTLWYAIIEVAMQVPAHHSGQARLADFVEALGQISAREVRMGARQDKWELWEDMPYFLTSLREHFKLPLGMGDDYDEEIAESNLNLNSFMARLLEKNMVVGLEYPIWVFREALEEPYQRRLAMDSLVDMMNEWISHAGEVIYESINSPDLLKHVAKVTPPGSLYQGPPAISYDRWENWKEQLRSTVGSISTEKEPVLERILQRMTEIENNHEVINYV
ncbi:hypothetical protein N7456_000476 [Penicillium angulare]|uniref:Uncharacterized protein n=1 Tax=Penicillium angulare TaxID=116970 RepID=A0A9W9GC37_9EURO|nr:hypothetical protein N7456_000476 [Penicillium angulare]